MKHVILSAIVFLFVAGPLAAQDFQAGLIPFQSYDSQGFDSVNLSSGNLVINIPLVSYPQKGSLPSVGYFLSSNTTDWVQSCYTDDEGYTGCSWDLDPNSGGGSVGVGAENEISINDCSWCVGGLGISINESNGAQHASGPTDSTSHNYFSMDASGYKTSYSSGTWTVIDRNGISHTPHTYGTSWTDPSGNTVTSISTSPYGYTDSFGRSIPAPPYTTGCNTVDYPVPGGGTAPYTFCYASATISSDIGTSDGSMCTIYDSGSYGVWQLQSVTLPNGTSWAFTYDSYGDLLSVTTPTGGEVAYTYQLAGSTSCGYDGEIEYREIVTRAVTPTSGGSSQTWSYSGFGSATTTVTDPDGNNTQHTFWGLGPYETETKYYSGTTTLLKTVDTQYFYWSSYYYDMLPEKVTTTWPDGHVSAVCTIYDDNINTSCTAGDDAFNSSGPTFAYPDWGYTWLTIPVVYGSPLYKYEYDYGSGSVGSLLRQTIKQFEWQSSGTYLNGNFLNLPASVQIKDGGGTQRAYTTYSYDESFTGNYTSCSPGPCGHQTSVHSWDSGSTTSTSNCGISISNGYLVSYTAYNSDGTVNFSIDHCGASNTDTIHRTSYTYGSTSPSPTQIQYPTTGGVSHVEHFTYDSNTGLTLTHTDQNSQTTSFSYDNMRRETEIDYPDTGQINYTYTDTTPNPYVIFTQKITSGMNFTEQGTVDGLGRLTQTQLTSDPEGTDYTYTTYDSLGRVSTVSNAYRSTSDSTYGGTTYNYDALNRSTAVTEQDGSVVSTSYSGPCTTVTDEAGKVRQSCADGLGRLTSVVEDPSGLNYTTNYTYDALDNLTGVTQVGSRTRTFSYDSLSRLTSAANPESGTTYYTYDADGNVVTKTDARSITATNSYDPLNRVTSTIYSDSVTPNLYFSYDVAPSWMSDLTNVVGRLVEESNQYAGSYGTTLASAVVNKYDAMGRVVRQWQQTPATSPGGYYVYHSYDLAGGLTSTTDPAGVTISYTPGGAERVLAVTSSLVDTTHPETLADGIYYTAPGAMDQVSYGNGLLESRVYNNRLQPSEMKSYYGSGYVRYNLTFGFTDAYGHNNGNLQSWNSTGADFVFSRSYTYDSLNRLATMSAPGDTCSGLSWTYDAWGNRTDQNATGGTCGTFHASVGTDNRLTTSGYNYDAAGNMTQDASHSYTYDAENRVIQVDSGSTASYVYDPSGRRIRKNSGGSWTEYLYDVSGKVIAETNGSSWLAEYAYLNGQLLAEYKNSTTYFAQEDHLGSTRLLTGPDGSGQQAYDYLPFGELTRGAFVTDHLFTGKERDSESNLDNFGARYDSSAMGRFMSPDPKIPSIRHLVNPQKWNKYSYTLNNPLRYFDPDGMEELEIQLRAYIPQYAVWPYKGDDRGPTTSQAVTSRTEVTVRIQTDQSKVLPGASPMLGPDSEKAGQTENIFTGRKATQTEGLPMVTSAKFDSNGNAVITIQQSTVNPLAPPGTAPIRSDLTITIPSNGSTVTTTGTVSGSPSFELNVFGEGGTATNVPLQTAPSNPLAFILELYGTKDISNTHSLPAPPPDEGHGCDEPGYACNADSY
jgi:RHS repeat-associated protein